MVSLGRGSKEGKKHQASSPNHIVNLFSFIGLSIIAFFRSRPAPSCRIFCHDKSVRQTLLFQRDSNKSPPKENSSENTRTPECLVHVILFFPPAKTGTAQFVMDALTCRFCLRVRGNAGHSEFSPCNQLSMREIEASTRPRSVILTSPPPIPRKGRHTVFFGRVHCISSV
ncbi:hypothetical protein B0H63DRAFT_138990 [Podospora didyma]|uniref:Uncharacterized protein n=1 Tax=Podospora didyma TaxID=330526 RepID=A0AAE0NSA6_9PEZI|nr:hypothetical protein B0H63DRAFT_138990 [Podospora didyma]